MSAGDPHSPTVWHSGAASQLGGRHEQQDRWGLFPLPAQGGLLAVVADGMGGHLDGALGAQIILDTVRDFTSRSDCPLCATPMAALEQLCQQMHAAINQRSEAARSTTVMAWLSGRQIWWLNIGDSRLYHFRRGQRLMRTRDHSAVQLLMDLGEIDEAQMATHPAQNRLYRCLGGEDMPKPDTGHFTIEPGDLLVLCSDGIWEHIRENEYWDAAQHPDLDSAAHLLAEQAVHRGGAEADNATLVLLRAARPNKPAATTPWWQQLGAAWTALLGRGRR